MQEGGFPMVNYGATVKNFNEPSKLLEALIKARKRPSPRLPGSKRLTPGGAGPTSSSRLRSAIRTA